MLTRWWLQTRSPIKRLFQKLENSIQTYINYHKTHVMATHYVGIGDTSMEDPEAQDLDSTSQDDFQDENIVQNLLHKTKHLKQAIEDRDKTLHSLRIGSQTLKWPQNWQVRVGLK